jgi:hypothetical protein
MMNIFKNLHLCKISLFIGTQRRSRFHASISISIQKKIYFYDYLNVELFDVQIVELTKIKFYSLHKHERKMSCLW